MFDKSLPMTGFELRISGCWRQPLYQLSHNHCQFKFNAIALKGKQFSKVVNIATKIGQSYRLYVGLFDLQFNF